MSKTRPTIICYTSLEIKDKAKAVAKERRRPVSKLVEDLIIDAHNALTLERKRENQRVGIEPRPSLI